MLGKKNGYQMKTIFKFMAKKDGFGLADSEDIEKQEQQETVLSILNGGGRAFGIYKKKELMTCYLFEKVKVSEAEIPYPKYDINKESSVIVQELREDIEKVVEEFEKAMVAELKELIMLDEVKAVIWNEKILTAKQVKVGADRYVSAIPLGISVGMLFGVILDNIALGICFGVMWGLVFGMIFTATGSKEQEEM